MGEYADVKRKKILQFLKKLAKVDDFEVTTGGHHQWIIKHRTWLRPFPIPFEHNKIKKCYIQDLVKLIIKTGDCTEETLKDWLR